MFDFNSSSSASSGGTSLTVATSIHHPSSPACYPPREVRLAPTNRHAAGGVKTIRPSFVLEGHGEGAVFDVKWFDGGMASAGEDGAVGVWGVEDEFNGEDNGSAA